MVAEGGVGRSSGRGVVLTSVISVSVSWGNNCGYADADASMQMIYMGSMVELGGVGLYFADLIKQTEIILNWGALFKGGWPVNFAA